MIYPICAFVSDLSPPCQRDATHGLFCEEHAQAMAKAAPGRVELAILGASSATGDDHG